MMRSSCSNATVSPPRWEVVAGLRPNSSIVGTAKSPFGPLRWIYELSLPDRWIALMSGSWDGCVCSKSREESPGSGMEVGAGMGRATSPILSAA